MKKILVVLTIISVTLLVRNAFTPAETINIKKGAIVYLDGKIAGTVAEIHGDIVTLDALK